MMAHKTTRRGGRPWWGSAEAKSAGRVTRRRDDRVETDPREAEREYLLAYADPEVDQAIDELDRLAGREPLSDAAKTDLLARDLGYLEEDDG